ncbi:MAG: tetratricopeptide repeat protein, partial [Candidatus Eisenbacteria bacterium]
FEDSRKTTPNDKDLAYYHAVTLGLTGNLDLSLARFKDAIALDPDDGQAYFAAYSIARDAGRPQDAAQVLRQWVARHPDDPQATMMLRQLEAEMSGGAPAPAPLPEGAAPGSIAPPGGPGGAGGGVPGGTQ